MSNEALAIIALGLFLIAPELVRIVRLACTEKEV